MEFKWSINKLTVAEDNLVVKVELTVTGHFDNYNSASAVYTCNLARGNSFIPYDQLTEQQVLAWCFAPQSITTIDPIDNVTSTVIRLIKDEGEAQVTGQIERQLAKKVTEPALPWAQLPQG
jgi:hypothetical protein